MRKAQQISSVIILLIYSSLSVAELDFKKAAGNIFRVDITDFKALPSENIFKEMGCSVPQVGFVNEADKNKTKHESYGNVIQGQFAKKGQNDWAVLCSRNNVSSIFIMWGGDVKCPSEIAKMPDKSYLQSYGDDVILFSRWIAPAHKEEIHQLYEDIEGELPPVNIVHEGINNVFESKASVIHYCHNGKWLKLTGYD